MIQFSRWKIIMVLGICLLGMIYAAPNLMSSSERFTAWRQNEDLPGWLPLKTVNLGLDLQGGVHMLLQVGLDEALAQDATGRIDAVRDALIGAEPTVGYTDLKLDGGAVRFTLRNPDDRRRVMDLMRGVDPDMEIDVEDGVNFVLGTTESGEDARARQIIDQSIEIVRRRVDALGTTEPLIQRQGRDRILLQIPGVDDPDRVKEILGRTAQMNFHLVNADYDTRPNADPGAAYLRLPVKVGEDEMPRSVVVQRRVALSGEHLKSASAGFHPETGQPIVNFSFNAVGARIFSDITTHNVNRRFAVVLDGEIITDPRIIQPIPGGSGFISGSFTPQEAADLALLLRAGALPAPLEVLEERSVGATLGADSVEAGKWAAIIGLILVAVFIAMSYGRFGLMANVALVINLVLIFAVLSVMQATLTLPGIAGIVLTIGMAVDANVLIFERIREELSNGRTPLSAVDTGYSRAVTTIIDANVTTLIAAMFLYALGSGPVKGFAVTLTVGLLTSMFTAIMVTRLMVVTWLRRTRPATLEV